MRGVRRVFRLMLFKHRDVSNAVDEELAFHLAMREARLRAGGMPDPDAGRVARARFGDLDAIRRECLRESQSLARTERAMMLFDEIRRDAHFAIRSLWRSKGFAAAIILTLALGIGANATIFSLIDAVVLQPVHGVANPERLFELGETVSYPDLRDLRTQLPTIRVAGLSERPMALGHGAGAETALGALVSGNFFDLVGVHASLGRTLQASDDVSGAAPVGVLTHEYWMRAFGSDSSILGRTVTINGAPVTVVGVAARGFRGLHLGRVPAVWIPVHAWPAIVPSSQRAAMMEDRGWGWLRVVGRIPPGMTFEQVHAAVATIMNAVSAAPADVIRMQSTPRPAQAAALSSNAREGVVRFVAVLAGVVILVLLTACANIAGLLLSRASFREREIGVRIALGAGRFRLMRQLLTEALVLAAAGGIAGICVFLGARAFLQRVTLPGGSGMPGSSLEFGLDTRLISFAIAVTVLTGLIFGLAPALQASRSDTVSALKGSGLRRGSWQRRLRGALVTAQVAVALVLLVGTGLFSRALSRAFSVELGFEPEPLVAVGVAPGLAQLDPQRTAAYYALVTERIAALPGVQGVSWTRTAPLGSDYDRESAEIEGYTPGPDEKVRVEMNSVGPRYHEVMGIRLLSGRGFDERDARGAQPVIVVNETLAQRYFSGRSAIGKYITMHGNRWLIVGVARDAKYHEVNESPRPYAYFPALQLGTASLILIVRASDDAGALLPSLLDAVRSANPSVPVYTSMTMTDRLRTILAPQLVGAWLMGVFSLLALVVAAVGIYGIVAYAVSQRTREIGIRMALGARGRHVLRLIVGVNLGFVALGIPIGIALAVILARGMTRFLYGVGTTDALTLITTSALMLVVGLIASFIPARRAVRIDQMLALRADA